MEAAPHHKRRHRGGRKHRNKNHDISNASSSPFAKKHDSVAAIRADQIAEGRRMMKLDPDA